jgi:hypothetical protein
MDRAALLTGPARALEREPCIAKSGCGSSSGASLIYALREYDRVQAVAFVAPPAESRSCIPNQPKALVYARGGACMAD